jgi:hypothetical protein
MMSFKKRGLELLELMRTADSGTVFHGIELMRATGFSRALIVGSLTWLEDCQAVELHIDPRGRHCWTLADEEPDRDNLPDPEPVVESYVGLDDSAEVLDSLRHDNDPSTTADC